MWSEEEFSICTETNKQTITTITTTKQVRTSAVEVEGQGRAVSLKLKGARLQVRGLADREKGLPGGLSRERTLEQPWVWQIRFYQKLPWNTFGRGIQEK